MIVHSSKNPIILNESRRWQYRYAEKFGIDPSDVKSSAKLNGRDYDKLENKGLLHLKDQEKGNKIYAGKGKPVSDGKAYYKPTNLIAGQRMNPDNIIIPDSSLIKTDEEKKPSFGLINLNRRVDSHTFRNDKENQRRLTSEIININSLPNGDKKKEILKNLTKEEFEALKQEVRNYDKPNKNLPKEFKSDPGEKGIPQK